MSENLDIGQLLLKEKVITQEQWEHAKHIQDKSGGLLEMILVKQGIISPQNLTRYIKILEEKQKELGITSQPAKKMRLGEILLADNVITQEQLEEALEYQKEKKVKIGIALVELDFIERSTLVRYLTKQSQMVIDSTGLMTFEATDMVTEAEKK